MERDFTYIDDIVNGVVKVIEDNMLRKPLYEVMNIGRETMYYK